MPASIYDWTAVWVKSFSWLWPPHRGSELEAVCTAPQVQLRAISKTLLLLLYHLAVLLWIPGERWELGERQVCLLSLRVFLTMGTNADLLLTPPHLHMTETSVATLLSPVAFMCVQIHPVHTSGWSVSRAWFPTGHCTHPAPTIATVPSSRPLYLLELSAGWLSPFSLIPSSHSFSLMSRHHQFLTAVLHLPLSFGCSGAAYAAVGLEQPCANRSASTQCCARLSTASRSGAGPTALLCPQDMLPCPATAFYDSSRSQIALKLLVLRYIW